MELSTMTTLPYYSENICRLCCGMVFLPYVNTVSVAAFLIHSAAVMVRLQQHHRVNFTYLCYRMC
jgi:hypothetical protein